MEGTTEVDIRLLSEIKNLNLRFTFRSCTLTKQCIRMTNSTGKSRASYPGSSQLHIVYARRNNFGTRTVGLPLLLLCIQCFHFLIGFGRPYLSAKTWISLSLNFPSTPLQQYLELLLLLMEKNKSFAK